MHKIRLTFVMILFVVSLNAIILLNEKRVLLERLTIIVLQHGIG